MTAYPVIARALTITAGVVVLAGCSSAASTSPAATATTQPGFEVLTAASSSVAIDTCGTVLGDVNTASDGSAKVKLGSQRAILLDHDARSDCLSAALTKAGFTATAGFFKGTGATANVEAFIVPVPDWSTQTWAAPAFHGTLPRTAGTALVFHQE